MSYKVKTWMIFVQDSDETFVINPQTFERRSVWRCWTGADHMSQFRWVSWGAENIVRDMVTSLGDRYRVLAMRCHEHGAMGQGSIGMVRSCSGTSLCSHLCLFVKNRTSQLLFIWCESQFEVLPVRFIVIFSFALFKVPNFEWRNVMSCWQDS